MKDLTQLSDAELLAYYNEMGHYESLDYKMDGSGELGSAIAKTWKPVWEAFEAEFAKREICLNTSEIPC